MKTVRTKRAHNIKMITFLHQSGNVDTKPIPDTNAKAVNSANTAIPIVHPVNAACVVMAANTNTADSTNVAIRIVVMFDVAAWGVICLIAFSYNQYKNKHTILYNHSV